MFFFKLESSDLERLLKLATEKGMHVERLARLAFLKGLRFLAKADTETEVTEPSAAKRTYTSRKPTEEVQDYIRQHWEHESDEEMGQKLHCKRLHIFRYRLDLGLKRKRGHRSLRQQKGEQLDVLIREHWETKDDWEIGGLMEPNVPGTSVRLRRYELGLKKIQGAKREKVVREVVEPAEFERMVVHDGYTMTDYLRFKGLHCGRERLRQVAEELGLKHSPEDRAPEWELRRKARQVGNLNLANREWLAERLSKAVSISLLAAELEVNEPNLYFFIRRFELTHPQIRKYGTMTVDLVCAQCGTEFKRLKRWVDRRVKTANGKELEYFCSMSCAGLYNKVRNERRKAEGLPAYSSGMSPERQQKMAEQNAYISEHWQQMSDQQMANILGLVRTTVTDKRLALGLKRV